MTTDLLEHTSTDYEDLQQKLQRVRGEVWGGYATLPQRMPERMSPAKVTIRVRTEISSSEGESDAPSRDTTAFAKALLLMLSDDDESSGVKISSVVRDSIDSLRQATEALASLTHEKSEVLRESLQAYTAASEITTLSRGLRRLLERSDDSEWTDAKNERRCDLIDKDIEGTILPSERRELEELQQQMLAYRRKMAPLPLKEAQRLHQELLKKAAEQED